MNIYSFFKFCPRCCSAELQFKENKHFICENCHWEYFHNTAAAAGAIIRQQDKILLITRKREPGKGKLDLPGGFVDPGESAEQAVRREVREEIGITLPGITYFKSYANIYHYRGIVYHTCDIYFLSEPDTLSTPVCSQEVAEVTWFSLQQIDPAELAFASTKQLFLDLHKYKHNQQFPM